MIYAKSNFKNFCSECQNNICATEKWLLMRAFTLRIGNCRVFSLEFHIVTTQSVVRYDRLGRDNVKLQWKRTGITKPAQFASIGSRKILNCQLRKNNGSDTLIPQKIAFCELKN